MDEIVSIIKTEIECLRDLAKARSGKHDNDYNNGREQGSIEVCELLLDFISLKEKTRWMPLDNH